MSNLAVPGQNRGQKARYLNGGASLLVSRAPIEPDDRQNGCWSREQLETMNGRFVAALEATFALGLEHRASACAEFAGVRQGSAVVACSRAAAWRRASSGAPWGGMSSMAFV